MTTTAATTSPSASVLTPDFRRRGGDPAWPLSRAVELALAQHWRGRRKEAHEQGRCRDLVAAFPTRTLDTLTTEDLQGYLDGLAEMGLGDEAAKARMCSVSVLYTVARRNGYRGPVPTVPRPYVTRKLKWWLKPDLEPMVIAWLRSEGLAEVADFVEWTVSTGLRVEESLGVQAGDFIGLDTDEPELVVPGTKTAGSHAAAPISQEAAEIAMRRLGMSPDGRLFAASYMDLWAAWQKVRREFGLLGIKTATLKALRRSYTRRLSVKGAPLPVVQQLMRQASPTTTMEYLRLTGGGFTSKEMRRWLANAPAPGSVPGKEELRP